MGVDGLGIAFMLCFLGRSVAKTADLTLSCFKNNDVPRLEISANMRIELTRISSTAKLPTEKNHQNLRLTSGDDWCIKIFWERAERLHLHSSKAFRFSQSSAHEELSL